jgi:hypothetical protein
LAFDQKGRLREDERVKGARLSMELIEPIGLSDNSCESQLTKPAFESVGFTSTCHQPFEGIRAYSGGKTIGMREDKYAQQDHHHHAAVKRNQQAPFGRWGR